jgi:hypothetical protein
MIIIIINVGNNDRWPQLNNGIAEYSYLPINILYLDLL